MKNYAMEYLNNLKINHPFVLNNYPSIIKIASSITKNCDDDTYFWIQNYSKHEYKKMYTPLQIIDICYQFFNKNSKEIAQQFIEDIKNHKIKFLKAQQDSSKLVSYVSIETKKMIDFEIIISYTGTIEDVFALVHEYMHWLTYGIYDSSELDKNINSIYREACSIYSELLLMVYLPKTEDITAQIGKRIGKSIDDVLVFYNVISCIKFLINEENEKLAKNKFNKNSLYTYDSICEHIKSKKEVDDIDYFVGLIVAMNIFFSSSDRIADFLKLIEQANNSEIKFLESNLYFNLEKIQNYIIELRKMAIQSKNKNIQE